MDKFDTNKAWGEVKKAYKFQIIVVLILVVIMFIFMIPMVIPPVRSNNEVSENKQVDKVLDFGQNNLPKIVKILTIN